MKTFETEQNLHVSILVDSSASMGFGEPPKLDVAASLAAALGYLCLINEDGLTIAFVADAIKNEISSTRQALTPTQVFNFCKEASPGGRTHLDQALKAFAFHSDRPGLVFIISDFLYPGKLEESIRPLVYAGYDICGIHMLAEDEIQPRLAGEMDIQDSETGEIVPLTVRENTMESYRNALERFRRNTRQALKTCYANYLFMTNNETIEQVVLHELRQLGIIENC